MKPKSSDSEEKESKVKAYMPTFGTALPRTREEKLKTLEAILKQIKKEQNLNFMRLGERSNIAYPSVATGIHTLDHELLGVGGMPRGRVVEVFGPESSGKTTLLLMLIAAHQLIGELAAFVDAEHALDPRYAKALGVDTDNLLIAQPDYGEQALQATIDLVESGSLGIIVVDSVAALVPKAELDGDMEDAHVGLHARMMGKALRKLVAAANKTGTTVCFINQIREKIGVMFGSPETTTGGRALKFFASIRLDIRRIAQVKEGDVNAGNRTKIKIVKNKVDVPFREAEFDLMFGRGIDKIGDLTDSAIRNGVILKNGAQYTYTQGGDEFKGRAAVRSWVEDGGVQLYNTLQLETLKAMGKPPEYIEAVLGGKK